MATTKITIFYAYAPQDQRWQQDLETRINIPRANIEIEHLRRNTIPTGAPQTEIERSIEQADIIFLLLSHDFMNTAGHYNSPEVKHIRKLYFDTTASAPANAHKNPLIIPVHVRPTNWSNTAFAALVPVPRNGKALTLLRMPDKAWQEVMFEIEPLIESFAPPADDMQIALPGATQPIISKIPPQNSFFTGREDLLNKLWYRFTRQQTTPLAHKQALLGLGGTGKTQLAVKYMDLHRADYQYSFWVNAATRDILVEEYVEIAHNLALPEQNAQDQDSIVRAVMQWLEANTDWLLIMDNANRLAMVKPFIPTHINGHLLLTTQAQAVGEIAEALEVGNMTLEEGTLFLLLRAKKIEAGKSLADAHQKDREYAEKIVSELGGLPLALDQAGAYIEERQESLEKYLELYQNLGVNILRERGDLFSSHPASVTKTFLLTFTEVSHSKSKAADVLRLCAFLAPDAIPEKLLTEYLSTLNVETPPSSQTPKAAKNPLLSRQKPHTTKPPSPAAIHQMLGEASKVLLRYSLIHRDDHTKTFAVHHLVQAVLRESMDENMQRQWAERAVRIVGTAFPKVETFKMDVNTWPTCQELLPHVTRSASLIKKHGFSFPEVSRLLNDAATYLTERGQYPSAVPLYQQALHIRQENQDHLYAQSLQNLGRVYERLAEYGKAEQHLLKALAIQEQVLGENHPDVAATLNSLAALYKKRGRPQKARELYERAFQISHLSPDPEQFYLSEDFFDQIAFYRSQQDQKKTRELYKDALEKIKQKRGEDHPNTARILQAWGEFAKEQGDLTEAIEQFQRAREIREKWLGLENAETASTLNSIAELYERQGKTDDAEKLYLQALSIREKVLGPDHPETAASLYSLARLYRAQDKIVEAEELYQQVLSIRKKKFGPDHPSTLASQQELANFYKSQGRLAKAESLYKRSLASGYLTLMPDDATIIQNLRELLEIYTVLDKHEAIEQLYDQAFTERSNRLGINHPSTEQSLQDLSKFYTDHNEREKVVRLYLRTFKLRAQKLRGDDKASLQKFEQNLRDLSNVYDQLKLPDQKLHLYIQADRICSRVLGAKDRLAVYCRNQWIKLSENPVQGKEAEKYVKGQLVEITLELQADYPDTISDYLRTKLGLADLLKQQQRFEEAERVLQQGLQDSYKKLGFYHPNTIESRHELVRFYEEHHRFEDAKRVYQAAIEYCKMKHEPQNPHLLECRNDLISLYLRHKKHEDAKREIKDMLQLIRPIQDEQPVPQPYTLTIIRTLTNAASLYQRIYPKKKKVAEQWFEQALQLSKTQLGKQHPETITARQHYFNFLKETGNEAKANALEIDAAMEDANEANHKNDTQDEQAEQDGTILKAEDIEIDEDGIE